MKDTPKSGFSPYIRAFYKGAEIPGLYITKLKYEHDEKKDDCCEIECETGDRDFPAFKLVQEGIIWTMIWGYIKGDRRKRIVKLKECEWQFSDTHIKGRIKAIDLGSVLREVHSKKVHKNTNLLHLAGSIAEKHGLELESDMNKSNQDKLVYGPDGRIIRMAPLDPELQNLTKTDWKILNQVQGSIDRAKQLKDPVVNTTNVPKVTPFNDIDKTFVKVYNNYKPYETIPQAGKSDRHILDEVAITEPGGPYMVETRDNKMILRKRDFKRAPYRVYEYGGKNSDLIEFSSTVRNHKKGRKGTAIKGTGWDKDKKVYHSVTMEPGVKPGGVLGKFMEQQEVLGKLSDEQLKKTDKVLAFKSEAKNQTTGPGGRVNFFDPRSAAIITDATNVVKLNVIPKTFKQELDAANTAVQLHDAKATKPEDSIAKAENLRHNSELERHPGSCKIIGDPNLEPGMIITILQVSAKYIGNWYVCKVTDEIGAQGYFTELEIKRHGNNIKVLANQKDVAELGLTNNTQIGPAVGEKKRIKVKVKHNK